MNFLKVATQIIRSSSFNSSFWWTRRSYNSNSPRRWSWIHDASTKIADSWKEERTASSTWAQPWWTSVSATAESIQKSGCEAQNVMGRRSFSKNISYEVRNCEKVNRTTRRALSSSGWNILNVFLLLLKLHQSTSWILRAVQILHRSCLRAANCSSILRD